MSRFDYIIQKIADAPKRYEPFEQIYIEDLFTTEDFAEIVSAREIDVPSAANDDDLLNKLDDAGYKIVEFPGCIVDKQAYVDWHRTRGRDHHVISSSCEGFGMTLRLLRPSSPVLVELKEFLEGEPFNRAIADRFGIDLAECTIDGGIQKYLDGYEISPHPDVRRKAGTFMVNINPHAHSEEVDHHTHYLRMKPEYTHVRAFWDTNALSERCWVPWDWCETEATQPKNNSIVIFSPSNETMHGVKTNYDHLRGQRTQLYGNLWYKATPPLVDIAWEDFAANRAGDVLEAGTRQTALKNVKALVPASVKSAVRSVVRKATRSNTVHRRNY